MQRRHDTKEKPDTHQGRLVHSQDPSDRRLCARLKHTAKSHARVVARLNIELNSKTQNLLQTDVYVTFHVIRPENGMGPTLGGTTDAHGLHCNGHTVTSSVHHAKQIQETQLWLTCRPNACARRIPNTASR